MNFYDEAIQAKHDLQLELVRRHRTIKDVAQIESVQALDTPRLALNTIYSHDIAALEDADPYFWDSRIAQLVLATGQQLPDSVTFDLSWLRGKAGYWWFGRSSPLIGISHDNERRYVSSLLWSVSPNGTVSIQTFHLDGRTEYALGSLSWAEGETLADAMHDVERIGRTLPDVPDLVIRNIAIQLAEKTTALGHELVRVTREVRDKHLEVVELKRQIGEQDNYDADKFEADVVQAITREKFDNERLGEFRKDYLDRLEEWTTGSKNALVTFACGCLWLQQKIITVAQAPLTRAAERRLARANIDPKCLVVELRSKQYTRTTSDEEAKHVDWAWQWAVRGHWRDQPTKEGNKLIWIHPYIKGPEDKPLKPDAGRVFAVTR